MKFLIDTDTCIYALKQNAVVLQSLLAQSPEDIALSVITEAELRTERPRAFLRQRRCTCWRVSSVL